MGQMPVAYVCCGSKCKARKKARKALVAALEPVAHIEYVDCQKICGGPVAGFEVAGKLEWFADLRKEKALRKLVTLIEEGRLTKGLQKRWVKKRSGKRRGCGDVLVGPAAVDDEASPAEPTANSGREHAEQPELTSAPALSVEPGGADV